MQKYNMGKMAHSPFSYNNKTLYHFSISLMQENEKCWTDFEPVQYMDVNVVHLVQGWTHTQVMLPVFTQLVLDEVWRVSGAY